ncbi:hypothetical protein OMK64_01900 [Cellulomonas fimi]|uniref:hypothetical protein n=1 Tax=Cellulomonas fimi TaxID=1708 RepID=UPI00234C090D|nr:hypothetical protein [Cellulomonas fimi]MDC7120285.1 hypothetical protein [Cellulomonas fimi]
MSMLDDAGIPTRLMMPVGHGLLPRVLDRKSTIVRRVSPGAVLPAPATLTPTASA